MTSNDLEEKLLSHFKLPDLELAEELAVQFQFRPDVVLKNNDTVRAFIIRKSNGIPFEFIDRFSEATNFENCITEKYIAFLKKPEQETIIKCTEENQIGVLYISKGILIIINPKPKDVVLTVVKEYEMPHTVIFFSSIEELPERKNGKRIVELINSKYTKSIWANLIERDKKLKTMTPQALNKEICEAILKDEFFLGILAEDFTQAVESEIQFAMQYKSYENIILLVKDNDETRHAWRYLLADIEIRFKSRRRTVWYTKYDNIEDFEETFRKEVMELISKKHKENGATFL